MTRLRGTFCSKPCGQRKITYLDASTWYWEPDYTARIECHQDVINCSKRWKWQWTLAIIIGLIITTIGIHNHPSSYIPLIGGTLIMFTPFANGLIELYLQRKGFREVDEKDEAMAIKKGYTETVYNAKKTKNKYQNHNLATLEKDFQKKHMEKFGGAPPPPIYPDGYEPKIIGTKTILSNYPTSPVLPTHKYFSYLPSPLEWSYQKINLTSSHTNYPNIFTEPLLYTLDDNFNIITKKVTGPIKPQKSTVLENTIKHKKETYTVKTTFQGTITYNPPPFTISVEAGDPKGFTYIQTGYYAKTYTEAQRRHCYEINRIKGGYWINQQNKISVFDIADNMLAAFPPNFKP